MRERTKLLAALILTASTGNPLRAQVPALTLDTLIVVGDHKLHLHCIGTPGTAPLVLFESGGGGSARDWQATQERLTAPVRSCAYDRAGAGLSEPGPAPRTMRQEAFELHALLEAAQLRGPLVLVGHSIGALLVRRYAQLHDGDVVGMVLVDPTHESSVLYSVPLGRWVRLREMATGRTIPEPRLHGAPSTTYDPAQDFLAEEFQELFAARTAHPVPLGDKPLIVLGAGIRAAPPGTSDSLWKELRRERDAQVRDLVALSRNAKFVLDSTSTHNMPSDDPAMIARAIDEILQAISRRTALRQ
jgi:pimeloyl-ACP methyl ester carboxylesterase